MQWPLKVDTTEYKCKTNICTRLQMYFGRHLSVRRRLVISMSFFLKKVVKLHYQQDCAADRRTLCGPEM